MLQKPDIEKAMLPNKAAKDRLVAVWHIIDSMKWMDTRVKIIAKLTEEMQENKGNVSAYLGGKRAMSDNFYNTFMEKYSHVKGHLPQAEKVKEVDDHSAGIPKEDFYVETISDLRKSGVKLASANEETATANRVLAEAQRDLIQVLKAIHKPTADAAKGIRQDADFLLDPYLDKMAIAGVGKYWDSAKQGRIILGKLLTSGGEPKEG